MFYKIGFFVLLAIVLAGAWLFMRSNPMKAQGAASWIEFYSSAPAETVKFLNETLGIKGGKQKVPTEMEYTVLQAKGQLWPFAGIMDASAMPGEKKVVPSTMVYLTTLDYEATHEKMVEKGATAVLYDKVVDTDGGKMKFGVYVIPGDFTIGIAQYGVK
jgi:predicted enzyme related to lactoylglutathione lyase